MARFLSFAPGCWGRALLLVALVFPGNSAAGETAPDLTRPELITLANPACEAVVMVKPFVRLISFRLAGKHNYFVTFDSPNRVAGGRKLRPIFVTGAKLWTTPDMLDSYKFGLLPGRARQKGNTVDVELGPDPASGLAGQITFALDATLPRIVIASTLRNAGSVDRPTGCWWPVSFVPGGRMTATALRLASDHEFTFHLWADNPPTDSICDIEGGEVTLNLDRPMTRPTFKIGFVGREISVLKPDCTYHFSVIDPVPDPRTTYSLGDSCALLYRDQRTLFCEAELAGPLVLLHPGEGTSLTFSIALEPPGQP